MGVDIATRKGLLLRLKRSLKTHEQDIYAAFWSDLRKSKNEVWLSEIAPVIHEINSFLKHLRCWSRPQKRGNGIFLPFSRGRLVAQPHGVVLVIAPWNYPLHLAIMPIIGAIAAGNSVVVKPSFNTPTVAKVIGQILSGAFGDREVYTIRTKDEGYTVLDYKWDFVFFTGGEKFGRQVAKVSGENLTPICLELGGKSPVIVDKCANIDMSARRIAWGKCLNAGQTCVAPDYALVHNDVADMFVERVKYYMDKFSRKKNNYVKIIDDVSFSRLEGLVESEPEKDVIICGENSFSDRTFYPVILPKATLQSECMQSEIFGPILPVIRIDALNDAITIINDRPKPLAIYYFGKSRGAKMVVNQTFSGATLINDVMMHIGSSGLPFGGVGNSGMGAYHGKQSFVLFSHLKPVVTQPKWFELKQRYTPYKNIEIFKKIIR